MDVILLDESGGPIGRRDKREVHGSETPLHQAFSCHLLDSSGRVLMTRRALSKQAWPGVWTNSFCGHPRPGEELAEAVARHGQHELGLRFTDLEMKLPDFRYRATDASGIVENEMCPVFTAVLDSDVEPNPDEVVEYLWVEPKVLGQALRATPWAFSPWLVLQAPQLEIYS